MRRDHENTGSYERADSDIQAADSNDGAKHFYPGLFILKFRLLYHVVNALTRFASLIVFYGSPSAHFDVI